MGPRRKKPRSIAEILQGYLEEYPDKMALKRGMILSIWPETVGPSIAEQVNKVVFRGSKLYMHIRDPSWRHEVHMQRNKIASQLNAAVKQEIIREIVVKS